MPLNAMCMACFFFITPVLGFGPIWPYWRQISDSCAKNWWTNILWINNLYPAEYDDKCLPWTFFMPCYVQLSLLVPPIVGIYKFFSNKVISGLILTLIGLGAVGADVAFVHSKNLGGSLVLNEPYLNRVFTNPLHHFSSFFIGMVSCFVYYRFMHDRMAQENNSNSSRVLAFISQNVWFRYPLYLVGVALMAGAVFLQTLAIRADLTKGNDTQTTLIGSLTLPAYAIGLSFLVLPALVGRAQLFTFFFNSSTWTMLSAMAVGLHYTFPCIAVFYFLSTQHQIQLTYYMMVYFFAGNITFAFLSYMILGLPVDRSLYALRHLKKDADDAEKNEFYRLDVYLKNFGSEPPASEFENEGSVVLRAGTGNFAGVNLRKVRDPTDQAIIEEDAEPVMVKPNRMQSGYNKPGFPRLSEQTADRTTAANSRGISQSSGVHRFTSNAGRGFTQATNFRETGQLDEIAEDDDKEYDLPPRDP